MTGTERLNAFIRKSTEERLKPQGMSSKLFWEIYDLLMKIERENGNNWHVFMRNTSIPLENFLMVLRLVKKRNHLRLPC